MMQKTKLATAIALTCGLLAGTTFAKSAQTAHYKMTTRQNLAAGRD